MTSERNGVGRKEAEAYTSAEGPSRGMFASQETGKTCYTVLIEHERGHRDYKRNSRKTASCEKREDRRWYMQRDCVVYWRS